MTIAAGVSKTLRYKEESTWGTAAGATGGQVLRRVSSTLGLQKATFESQEIRADYQIADYRHGTRRVQGTIDGELAGNSYGDLIEAAMRQDFSAGASFTATTGTTLTTTTTDIVRSGGSWITDGFRIGDVVELANVADAENMNTNLRVTGLTATNMTVAETLTLNASADSDATVVVTGQKTIIPTSSHTNKSFTMEHHHSDLDESLRFDGCMLGAMRIGLAPGQMGTISFDVIGKDMTVASGGSAPYFTSPTVASTESIYAGSTGTIRVDGTDIAVVTGLQLALELGLAAEDVIGSTAIPQPAPGRSRVTGQLTALFEGAASGLTQDFIDENEIELHMVMTSPVTGAADKFFSIFIPRIKLGDAQIGDGEQQIGATYPFQALLKPSTTGYDQTTLVIQDGQMA